MASTQHAGQHSRYPLSNYSTGDLRLPSLKDLNFYRPSPGNPQESVPSHNGTANDFVAGPPDHVARPQWSRSAQSASVQGPMPPHSQHSQPQPQSQQHSPPLSAGHEMTEQNAQYNKHDGIYARPGMPMSAQLAPAPGSVGAGPIMRSGDASPHSPVQTRRVRPPPTNINGTRDGRPSHNSYPGPYNNYPPNQPPPNSPYHHIPNQNHSHSAATSEQLNHNIPVSNHSGYNGYQQHYMQSRQSVHPPQHQPQPPQPPHHQQQLQHQPPPPHPAPPQHVLHPHHSQPQHQQQPASTPAQPPGQTSVHPSSLLQHPNQQSHLQNASTHQPSHSHQPIPHQPQQPTISSHAPHAHPYASPNPTVHPPQSPWAHQNHPQQSHHQTLTTPSHVQPPHQQPLPQSVHPHPHPHTHPQHPSHHQSNPVPAPTPQTMLQQAQQHSHQQQQHQQPPPPPPQPSQPQPQLPQPQSHPSHHTQAPTPIPHHLQHPSHHPPAPQPQQHSQSHPHPPPTSQPQPQTQPQQQLSFTRTAPVVPTSVDSRSNHYSSALATAPETERGPEHNDPMNEIVKYCNALYMFANHYASTQQTMPHVQPSPSELQDMSQKALQVVRLLENFKRTHLPEIERNKMGDSINGSSEDHRPPKRPWEDMGQDGTANGDQTGDFASGDKPQSTAEQDMQIIRSKRATSAAGASTTAGQAKSKYRKRSRATPPGKCHSCNIRETPEWRRGPDGARTLCNACGLHYAKLMRKREKADPTGQTPRIDLETLRASARAAEASDKSRSKHKNVVEPSSPTETKPNPQQHHQGSFQLMNVMAQDPNPVSSEPSRTIPPPQTTQAPPPPVQAAPSSLPVPPWQQTQPPPSVSAPQAAHGRTYAPEHLQHQSFMRTSQHTSAPQTSPR